MVKFEVILAEALLEMISNINGNIVLILGSRDGAVLRVLASHQCGLCSILL